MTVFRRLASACIHHPWRMRAACLALAAGCLATLFWRLEMDTEILNLLPDSFPSVNGLRVLNEDFRQGRELTFAVFGQDAETVESFTEHVADALTKEDWVLRFMHRSPEESRETLAKLPTLVVPLLLNLEANAFRETIGALQPEAISKHVGTLREQLIAGSPVAGFQLETDPLGVVAAAVGPMREAGSLSLGDPLATPDGRMRIILVTTRLDSLDAGDSRELMRKVESFRTRTLADWPGGETPDLEVTGRSAFVAEISEGMRRDVRTTLLTSLLMVGAVFWLFYRRLSLLAGIAILLLLACLCALAFGTLLFHGLNMITVGFFAILVGLGIDFGLLIYSRREQEGKTGSDPVDASNAALVKSSRGIAFGAMTTAAAFLSLIASSAAGFAQLGVLIASGIVFCALLLQAFLFAFLPSRARPSRGVAAINGSLTAWLDQLLSRPNRTLAPALAVFLPAVLVALYPGIPLRFDASPNSLDQRNSRASDAYHRIVEALPSSTEPVILLVEADDNATLATIWSRVESHWESLREKRQILAYSIPRGVLLIPERQRANARTLAGTDFRAVRLALHRSLETHGLNPGAFGHAYALVDRMEEAAGGEGFGRWSDALPPSSPWWFVLDRYIAMTPGKSAGFITPSFPLETSGDQSRFSALALPGDAGSLPGKSALTGWRYALLDLVPWANRELIHLSGVIGLAVGIMLAAAYRNLRLWLLHAAALALAVAGLCASLKLLSIPLNLLNVLAFPLVLGVGVDYGIHSLLALRQSRDAASLLPVVKPIVVCSLTTMAGFGSLALADNPALRGLGTVCTLGIFWCAAATLFVAIPAAAINPAGKSSDIRGWVRRGR